MQPLFLVELNEVNFDFVRRYVAQGQLPTFSKLINRHGVTCTTSEEEYSHIEPWIQWVTAHTGKTFAEHKVFRLGDIVGKGIEQIWELLEAHGLRVGALSPMNAENKLRSPAFFIPDPWTPTQVSAGAVTRLLHRAIVQAVGDNSEQRVSWTSFVGLLLGFVRHVAPSRWPAYLRIAHRLPGRPWIRAAVLDQLLGDVFLNLLRAKRPAFASLFLNGTAHVQHHYLFNSSVYEGDRRNPAWYVPDDEDPLIELLRVYDDFLANLIDREPRARILIATGLHQDSYTHETYYWRLKNCSSFLTESGVAFESAEALMSRDFVVNFSNASAAATAERMLRSAHIQGTETQFFEIENRGLSLFCTLVFDELVQEQMILAINGRGLNVASRVSFVALKNGHHNQIGYLVDSAQSGSNARVPLSSVFELVKQHFGVGNVAR